MQDLLQKERAIMKDVSDALSEMPTEHGKAEVEDGTTFHDLVEKIKEATAVNDKDTNQLFD